MPIDPAEQMLADAVAGLSPIDRARKLEVIGLALAKRYAREGDRTRELFWLERAQEASNEAHRIARTSVQVSDSQERKTP